MPRPLISLAVVFAIVVAAAAFLLYGAGQRGSVEPGAQQVAADAPTSTPTETPTDKPGSASNSGTMAAQSSAETPAPAAEGSAAPTQSEAAVAGAPPAEADGAPAEPTFDVVRVESTGEALIAGQATPGAEVEILANGIVIARATADAEGAFLAMPAEALAAGEHEFALRHAGSRANGGPEQHVAVIVLQGARGAAGGQGEQQVAMGEPPTVPAEQPATGQPAPGEPPAAVQAAPPASPGTASGGATTTPSEHGQTNVAPGDAATPPAQTEGPAVATAPDAAAAGGGSPSGRGNNGEPQVAGELGSTMAGDAGAVAAAQPEPSPAGEAAPLGAGEQQPPATVLQTEPEVEVAAAPGASTTLGGPSEGGGEAPAAASSTPAGTQAAGAEPAAAVADEQNGAAADIAASTTPQMEQSTQATVQPDSEVAAAPAASTNSGGSGEAGGEASAAASSTPADTQVAGAEPAAPAGEPSGAAADVVASAAPQTEQSAQAAAEPDVVGQEPAEDATVVAAAEQPVANVPISGAEGGAAPTETASAEGAAEAPRPDLEPGASTDIANGPPGDSGDVPAALTIRAAEVEADTLYVAGEAAPGALVRVFANDEFVGEAAAGDAGAWLLEAPSEVPVGDVVIRADVSNPNAAAPGFQVELPFRRYADGMVLEPVVTAKAEASAASGSMPQPVVVIIRRGDNLWRISRRNYGRGVRYEAIFAANRELIRNPDLIYPGQIFVMPSHDRSWETAVN